MRTKKALLTVSVTALVLVVVLVSLEAYYVAVALVAGTLLMGYRELWALLKRRKLPPIDERVRENTGKAVRNGFLFFAIATVFLMLPFSVRLIEAPDTVHVLGGLFVAAGAVYLVSYLFYDRVGPGLGQGELKMLKLFLLTAGTSLGAFVISVFLHNALSGLFEVEEPVFFVIAVFVSPLGFAVGAAGSLVIFIRGLYGRTR